MNLTLIKGQAVPLTVESSWLFIESYKGKLSVRLDDAGEEFTLPSGSVLRYGKPMGRILLSGEGSLSLEHGRGDFTPPVEGQKLEIQTMPQIELIPGQSMKVSELPEVRLEPNQSVRLEPNQIVSVAVSNELLGRSGELPMPVPANANRKGIIIKAPTSNTGVLSLKGFELVAGESVTLETTAGFTLSGTEPDTDTAHILEY
ncbi:hypothetical protein EDB59_4498 [Vibrio crassostreae]|uniref:hypothetical protein n=1 Tax=Vibrio crassostreae TaxID=246167 RepID=UPI000F48B810|nr:hypothetical protein [Vibrio crassostreae]ROR57428.1 hypothetical protein EDB59_4498 [Vibrio crassostreae]